MAWENGPSRTSTPEWRAARRRTLDRDGYQCTAIQHDGTRCPETSDLNVDHDTPHFEGGTDEDTNLRTLCKWHHDRKTAAEARRARVAHRSHLRPDETHPAFR